MVNSAGYGYANLHGSNRRIEKSLPESFYTKTLPVQPWRPQEDLAAAAAGTARHLPLRLAEVLGKLLDYRGDFHLGHGQIAILG
jgi:hypothetical protein